MKSFRSKYPGLSEEQLRIKYKIWEREKQLKEELQKESFRKFKLYEEKKRKNPFSRDDGDEDTGGWNVSADFGSSSNGHGVVSDAALKGAKVTFIYPDGSTKYIITDENGEFDAPSDFLEGDILVTGGFDVVTGLPYKGEFKIDGEFFYKYGAITPITHIANHIWLNTFTQTPDQAIDLVINYLPEIIGIPIPLIDPGTIFNGDHVKLTLSGVEGAKEIQAINTLIEAHSDLIGNTEANSEEEITSAKTKALTSISNALLIKINQQTNKNYVDSVFEFHDINVSKKYKDCCMDLISKASGIIAQCLEKDGQEATAHLQALNLAVKNEWSEIALKMTNDPTASKTSVWNSVENKTTDSLIENINLPQI